MHTHQRNVIEGVTRRKIDCVALFRSIGTARHEEVATVQRLETFHHGPLLGLRQWVDGCIELALRCQLSCG